MKKLLVVLTCAGMLVLSGCSSTQKGLVAGAVLGGLVVNALGDSDARGYDGTAIEDCSRYSRYNRYARSDCRRRQSAIKGFHNVYENLNKYRERKGGYVDDSYTRRMQQTLMRYQRQYENAGGNGDLQVIVENEIELAKRY